MRARAGLNRAAPASSSASTFPAKADETERFRETGLHWVMKGWWLLLGVAALAAVVGGCFALWRMLKTPERPLVIFGVLLVSVRRN